MQSVDDSAYSSDRASSDFFAKDLRSFVETAHEYSCKLSFGLAVGDYDIYRFVSMYEHDSLVPSSHTEELELL